MIVFGFTVKVFEYISILLLHLILEIETVLKSFSRVRRVKLGRFLAVVVFLLAFLVSLEVLHAKCGI